jgi:hypothetical protein
VNFTFTFTLPYSRQRVRCNYLINAGEDIMANISITIFSNDITEDKIITVYIIAIPECANLSPVIFLMQGHHHSTRVYGQDHYFICSVSLVISGRHAYRVNVFRSSENPHV